MLYSIFIALTDILLGLLEKIKTAFTGSGKVNILPLLSVNFIGALGYSIILPFLVYLVKDFGGNEVIYGLMGAVYPAFQLVGGPILGKWSDRVGRKKVLLISQIGTFVSWLVFIIAFFVTYQRRKNKLLREKIEAEQYYEKEISNTKIEIQEQTLKNIGWELHDNIGQLLSVAKMQLNMASVAKEIPLETIKDIKDVVADSLQEVRALSKSLNSDVIGNAGLEKSVAYELDRFSRLNVIQTNFSTKGEPFHIDQKNSLVIFRILQEFFSNVIKHSGADHLMVSFHYSENELFIEAKDDGVGFDLQNIERNSGLYNMESRAALINSRFTLNSFPNKGTSISLHFPKQPSQSNE